jgi:hypothetical protein
VKGFDQFDREMPVAKTKWSASGGKIDAAGVLTAPGAVGNYTVTVVADGKTGGAEVTVIAKGDPETKPLPIPPVIPKRLLWTGEVPPQKWTNLYMKVLTKLVSKGGLKLKVTIEAAPPDGITPQQLDEAKAGLRELGLSDDVKTE